MENSRCGVLVQISISSHFRPYVRPMCVYVAVYVLCARNTVLCLYIILEGMSEQLLVRLTKQNSFIFFTCRIGEFISLVLFYYF